jgi:DtxR family Mn-dependent transcriptional regulator
MYLITVYRLTCKFPRATTKEIATLMGVSAPSASERVKRLAEQGYLNHEWREGTTLTKEGERIAINVLRKHRLIETFLVKMADYAIDEIHDEACQIEHAMSDKLANRLDKMLGHPKVDPHGHPIPTKDGAVAVLNFSSLAKISSGETVVVQQVSDWDDKQLSYLCSIGVVPGNRLIIEDVAPFDGPLTLRIDGKVVAIAQDIAQSVGVAREVE